MLFLLIRTLKSARMRSTVFIFWVLCYTNITFGQVQKLSQSAEVYLLTISPGEELYSSFGHSTLLIEDYQNQVSEMYNYGSFDFSTEGFYVKFLRGTLPYQLTKNDLNQALSYWTSENRLVTKQRLRMSLSQKQKIYELIEENYQPQHRTYQYKFFYDNCSTRIRDLLIDAVGDTLQFNQSLNNNKSYRHWIETYAGHKAMADFGMDIAIGIPADEITGYENAMYIPDNLMAGLDSAAVIVDGSTKSFVTEKQVINSIYLRNTNTTPKKELNIPLIVSIILLLSSIYYFVNKRFKKISQVGYGNNILFLIVGLSGVILCLLWFFTDHGVTAYNLNILWANPVFIYMFFRVDNTPAKFFLFSAVTAVSVLVVDLVQLQDIPFTADILAAGLAIRLFTIYQIKNGTPAISNR